MSYANDYYGNLAVEGMSKAELVELLGNSAECYASWLPCRVNDDCTIRMDNYCQYDDWDWEYDIRALCRGVIRAGGYIEGTVYRDGEEQGDHEKIVVSDGGRSIERVDGRRW